MTNRVPDQTPVDRHTVFEEYQYYYRQTCGSEVWNETRVTEKAMRLLSNSDPDGRFRTIDFYHIALECCKIGSRDCRSVLTALIKATEMLEMLCVNLFLYPWMKEIKSFKTYTGAFVYCLKAVLPPSTIQTILATVGYQPQSDMQYVLADSVDPEKVIQVGFDLFLARMECEHLLQVMGQSPQPECLEILRMRTSPSIINPEEPASGRAERENQEKQENVVEGELCTGCSLVAPAPQEIKESQRSSRSPGQPELGLPQEAASKPATLSPSSGLRPSSTVLNEDRFILEMRCNYPDLAIRQKLIFSKRPRPAAVQSIWEKQLVEEPGGATPALASYLVGPQYTSHSTEAESPLTQPLSQNPLLGPTHWHLRCRGEQEAPEKQAGIEAGSEADEEEDEEEEVRLLAERMGQMYVSKENLGYPIEETGNPYPRPDQGSNRNSATPILCHPSLVPVCHIPECNSCGGGMDTLREPPHSVYVPACHLELCDHSQNQMQASKSHRVQMEYQAAGPRLQLLHAMEGCSVGVQHQAAVGPRVQQYRSPIQQPEDDLLKTYVMVEHDKK